MAAWSRLLLSKSQKLLQSNGLLAKTLPKNEIVRCMSEHRTLNIGASRWQWHKTKDWMHFYFWVGAIPVGLIIFCSNVFIGPATLEAIPEGYVPKRWEYYRSPITRFFARYCFPNPQQEYEKYLHFVAENYDVKQLKDVQTRVKEQIKQHQDYPAYYYKQSILATHVKTYRQQMDDTRTTHYDRLFGLDPPGTFS